jgi:hypothetical protein
MKGCPDCEKRARQDREKYLRNREKRKAKALEYYYKWVRPARQASA